MDNETWNPTHLENMYQIMEVLINNSKDLLEEEWKEASIYNHYPLSNVTENYSLDYLLICLFVFAEFLLLLNICIFFIVV